MHSFITTNKLAELNTESQVPGVNLLLKRILSALGAQNGGLGLETKYMSKTAFWTTFDGANRRSPYGDRVAKVKPATRAICVCSDRRLFSKKRMTIIWSLFANVLQSHRRIVTKENLAKTYSSHPNLQYSSSSHAMIHSSIIRPIWPVYFTSASGLTRCLE